MTHLLKENLKLVVFGILFSAALGYVSTKHIIIMSMDSKIEAQNEELIQQNEMLTRSLKEALLNKF